MCENDFNKKKETLSHLQFYSAQFEEGSETQKLHLQGYVQFSVRVTGKYVKENLGQNIHLVIPTYNPHTRKNSQ
jgi:hypothetical protein